MLKPIMYRCNKCQNIKVYMQSEELGEEGHEWAHFDCNILYKNGVCEGTNIVFDDYIIKERD